MKKARGLIVLLLSMVLAFSFAACGDTTTTEKFKVTIVNGAETTGLTDFSVKKGSETVTSGAEVEKGTVVSVSWTTATGYTAMLYVDGTSVSTATSPHDLTVNAAISIEVKATAKPVVTVVNGATTPGLTAFDVKQGTTSLAKASNTTVDSGTQLTVSWTVAETHTASLYVNDTIVTGASPQTVTVTANTSIEVRAVAKNVFTVRLLSEAGAGRAESLTALSVTRGGTALEPEEPVTAYAGDKLVITWTAMEDYVGALFINDELVDGATSPYEYTLSGDAGAVDITLWAIPEDTHVVSIDVSNTMNHSYQILNGGFPIYNANKILVEDEGEIVVAVEEIYDAVLTANGTEISVEDDGEYEGCYVIAITEVTEIVLTTELKESAKEDYYIITLELTDSAKEYIAGYGMSDGDYISIVEGRTAIGKKTSGYYENNNYIEMWQYTISLTDEAKKLIVYVDDVILMPQYNAYTVAPEADTVIRFDIEDKAVYNVSFVDGDDEPWGLLVVDGMSNTFQTDGFEIAISNTSIERFTQGGTAYEGAYISIKFIDYYDGTITVNGTEIEDEYGLYDIFITGNDADIVIKIDCERQQTQEFEVEYNSDHVTNVSIHGRTEYLPGELITIQFSVDTEATGQGFNVVVKINGTNTYTSESPSFYQVCDTTTYTEGMEVEIIVSFSTENYLISFVDNEATPSAVSISSLTGLKAEVDTVEITGSSVSVVYNKSVSIKFTNESQDKIYVIAVGSTVHNLLAGENKTLEFDRATTVKVYETVKYVLTLADEQGNATANMNSFSFYNTETYTNYGLSISAEGLDAYSNNILMDGVNVTLSATVLSFVLDIGGQEVTLASGATHTFTISADTVIKVKGYFKLNIIGADDQPRTDIYASGTGVINLFGNQGYSVKNGATVTFYNYTGAAYTLTYNGVSVTVEQYANTTITIVDGVYTVKIV